MPANTRKWSQPSRHHPVLSGESDSCHLQSYVTFSLPGWYQGRLSGCQSLCPHLVVMRHRPANVSANHLGIKQRGDTTLLLMGTGGGPGAAEASPSPSASVGTTYRAVTRCFAISRQFGFRELYCGVEGIHICLAYMKPWLQSHRINSKKSKPKHIMI